MTVKKAGNKLFRLALTTPVTLAVLLFALSNRQLVPIELWPFELGLEIPLYIIVLVSLGAGILLGAVITWLSASTTRRRAREAQWRALDLERELSDKREKLS